MQIPHVGSFILAMLTFTEKLLVTDMYVAMNTCCFIILCACAQQIYAFVCVSLCICDQKIDLFSALPFEKVMLSVL